MITKHKPNSWIREVRRREWGYSNYTNYFDYQSGSDTITYEEGKRNNGHWPWKECEHVSDRVYQPIVARSVYHYQDPPGWYGRQWNAEATYQVGWDGTMLPVPAKEFNPVSVQAVLDQIDLNSKESVLLYSGVLQAVPLLGSVFKANRILKDAAKHLSKGMRKQPFTTVVKSLISADFVDRFVIRPTLDDMHKFQDATDYVIRVINTARERNAHRFALSSDLSEVVASKSGTFSTGNGDSSVIHGKWTQSSVTRSKAFVLVEAKYDLDAVSPLKVWAQRVGLTRPLESAWDLVPFSFVIDYFTRAGDFIAALSDEMSNVEGLRGQIVTIHDMWGTIDNSSSIVWTATGYSGNPIPSGFPGSNNVDLGEGYCKSRNFRRFRIPDPWQYLNSLQERINDYLTVDVKLSSTRIRTLLELFIQSKL
jgi:hypothetical protein